MEEQCKVWHSSRAKGAGLTRVALLYSPEERSFMARPELRRWLLSCDQTPPLLQTQDHGDHGPSPLRTSCLVSGHATVLDRASQTRFPWRTHLLPLALSCFAEQVSESPTSAGEAWRHDRQFSKQDSAVPHRGLIICCDQY